MNEVIVLFEVTIKPGKMDEYLSAAASLRDHLAKTPGFVRSERFESLANEGKLLSLSVWEDEESVTAWRNDAAHRACQAQGRESAFETYCITVMSPQRTYTMADREEAPRDSNEALL